MKKKISIINYILVTMLTIIGIFKIYILNDNVEIKNAFGNAIAFEYALAVLLIVPLVLQILMRVFSAHTLEMKATEQTIIPKKSIKKDKIIMEHTWNPVISIILLFLSILPILGSISVSNFLVRISTIIAILIYFTLIPTSYLWLYYEILNILNDKKEAMKIVKEKIKMLRNFVLGFALIVVVPTLIITKVDEFKDEKLINYVLSDIQNPQKASDGYLSMEDIKTRILSDYYPEDVYYKVIISGKENSINFATYIDNSDVVSTYIYELTDDGYKFKLKISNSSISKDDIEKYDGIFDN